MTEWIATTTALFDLAAGGSPSLIASFSQATLEPLVPFTIVRTRMQIMHAADAGFITDQDWAVAIGGAVVKERARVAGTGSLPLPLTNIGDDSWFLFAPF